MTMRTIGRGANSNVTGRFENSITEIEKTDVVDEEVSLLRTQFFVDASRTIVTENDSPDIGFRYSMNFYRGCEHGCAYCYARPTHEYLGLSAGIDFESKIFVKENAPTLLRERLMSRTWKPECIHISGITDCYQPAERRYELTRKCLMVLAEFRNPVSLITKNQLITRDVDVLRELAAGDLVSTCLSVTTLDTQLGRALEPRTSSPSARLRAIETLAKAGIPVGVNVAPLIPGLTDRELPRILKAARDAGAQSAGYTLLRLPYSVKDIFSEWLEKNRPLAKEKVLHQVRDVRDGKLNDPEFGSRMRGAGATADNIRNLFQVFTTKYGFGQRSRTLRTDLFQRPGEQLRMF